MLVAKENDLYLITNKKSRVSFGENRNRVKMYDISCKTGEGGPYEAFYDYFDGLKISF